MRFVHTSDWQIGAPFARIDDAYKRSLVQQARIDAIKRIGAVARDQGADFILVAGDLFDSASADKATVASACSAVGQAEVPVIAIPGNHDYAGPGSVWEQDFFRRQQTQLAPNLAVLTDPGVHETESAVILACPLVRRKIVLDPTEWLRSLEIYAGLRSDKPRIVLAHGSVQSFSGNWDDEDDAGSAPNLIDLARLPMTEIDYVALGDWHGTKQVGARAWYSGTPEPDRFPKGADNEPGNVLMVEVARGDVPSVSRVATGRLGWHDVSYEISQDEELETMRNDLLSLLGQRAGEDLMRLSLRGVLGIEAYEELERLIESLQARLLRLKLINRIVLAPTDDEIEALTYGGADPLIARVASQLVERSKGSDGGADDARVALRELYGARLEESAP
jgi:DNA repair exonuclease SbcCD nuclease subunit